MLAGVDECIPRRHQAEPATSRPTCCRTCATRRTCSRSSGRSSPSTTSLNPQAFYGGQNFWTVPNDPTGAAANRFSQPPYYLTETIPGYRQPEFSQTTTFVPRNRANLAANMVVDSNPTQPGYGTIRILQLPQDAVTEGPSQVQGDFESNAAASAELTLLRRGGSIVTLGNMITIPVGGGLLYIEPMYVTGQRGRVHRVLPVAAAGVRLLRRARSGFQPPAAAALGAGVHRPAERRPERAQAARRAVGSARRSIADLKQAQQYYATAQAALRTGNLAAYAQAIGKMKQAIDQRPAGRGKGSGAASGGSPSPPPPPATERQPIRPERRPRVRARPGSLAGHRPGQRGGARGARRKAYAR